MQLSENNQDIVILKSDGLPTYHFAHLVDDHFMRTNLVTRGEEWIAFLPIYIELFKTMDWEQPKYALLPIIMINTAIPKATRMTTDSGCLLTACCT